MCKKCKRAKINIWQCAKSMWGASSYVKWARFSLMCAITTVGQLFFAIIILKALSKMSSLSLSRLNELWMNAKSSISRLELLVQHVLFFLEFRINLEWVCCLKIIYSNHPRLSHFSRTHLIQPHASHRSLNFTLLNCSIYARDVNKEV